SSRLAKGFANPVCVSSIPAASTNFVQRYRLVARGPCGAPASELSGLSGEAVGPRPAPWSTRGPRLFKLWSGSGAALGARGTILHRDAPRRGIGDCLRVAALSGERASSRELASAGGARSSQSGPDWSPRRRRLPALRRVAQKAAHPQDAVRGRELHGAVDRICDPDSRALASGAPSSPRQRVPRDWFAVDEDCLDRVVRSDCVQRICPEEPQVSRLARLDPPCFAREAENGRVFERGRTQ